MNTELRCSFCNRPEREVAKLAAGPNVYICDACVRIAADIMNGTPPRPAPVSLFARLRILGRRLLAPFRRAFV